MPTHQQIAGFSDDEMVQRMITTHSERFNASVLGLFYRPSQPPLIPQLQSLSISVVVQGCSCATVGSRYPQSTLYGYDVTPAMIDYAKAVHRIRDRSAVVCSSTISQTTPLPLDSDSVNLVSMNAVLHVLSDPSSWSVMKSDACWRLMASFYSMTGFAPRCRRIWTPAPAV